MEDQSANAYQLRKQGKLAGRAVIDPQLVSSAESLSKEVALPARAS